MSLLFNMSRFVIVFLWRSKHLLISWLQSPSTVISCSNSSLCLFSVINICPACYGKSSVTDGMTIFIWRGLGRLYWGKSYKWGYERWRSFQVEEEAHFRQKSDTKHRKMKMYSSFMWQGAEESRRGGWGHTVKDFQCCFVWSWAVSECRGLQQSALGFQKRIRVADWWMNSIMKNLVRRAVF